MVYAYDQAIQLPVRDIYDTQLMMASINAAKDMYERGQKQIEDFYKSYGDFFSPISSDMDWYEQNVTGAARNFINQLYANGVDPLKSAEGRALIQQFINNTPVGEVNKRKQAAAAAQEYIKARGELEAKGLWNPDYERYLLGGRSLEDWNTETDGLWTRTSPGEFSDLNAATYKWFDKLEPSYLRTENGYDYTGVSPDAVQKVMASNIPGFIDSNIGGYHYELARRQLVAQGITDPTQDQVIERLRNNIQSANSEVLKETRSINPEYAQKLKFRDDVALENLRHRHNLELQSLKNTANGGRRGGGSSGNVTSYGQTLLMRGIANWAGSADPGAAGIEHALKFGDDAKKSIAFGSMPSEYLRHYSMDRAESSTAWRARFHGDTSRFTGAAQGGVNFVRSQDQPLLYTLQEMTSSTLGYPGARIGHRLNKGIPSDASMVPTGKVYTAPMQDGTYSQFVEVTVGNSDYNKKLWYEVTKTEPSPRIQGEFRWGAPAPWRMDDTNDQVYAPYGFSIIPSQDTANKWSIMDRGLNSAAGIGSDPYRQATGEILDNIH